jgi:hypothetical protein
MATFSMKKKTTKNKKTTTKTIITFRQSSDKDLKHNSMNNRNYSALGVVDKFISNKYSKGPPKIREFIGTIANNTLFIYLLL